VGTKREGKKHRGETKEKGKQNKRGLINKEGLKKMRRG
jgi:hypothetical protein